MHVCNGYRRYHHDTLSSCITQHNLVCTRDACGQRDMPHLGEGEVGGRHLSSVRQVRAVGVAGACARAETRQHRVGCAQGPPCDGAVVDASSCLCGNIHATTTTHGYASPLSTLGRRPALGGAVRGSSWRMSVDIVGWLRGREGGRACGAVAVLDVGWVVRVAGRVATHPIGTMSRPAITNRRHRIMPPPTLTQHVDLVG